MIRIRPVLALLLALIVAATSGAMAVARGQTVIAGQIVLCTGTGPVSVNVDADGQPVGPPHICPDCVMSLMAAVASPVPEVVYTAREIALRFAAPRSAAPKRPSVRPRARAPPVA